MAIDTPVATPVAKIRNFTRQIICECPYDGENELRLFRQNAELDAGENLLRLIEPWQEIKHPAADIAAIVFTRADGSTFTGAALMGDMKLVCDVIASLAAAGS